MSKDLKIEIKERSRKSGIKSVIMSIQNDLEEFMEEYNKKRIVMPISNTVESITLASVLTPLIDRRMVDLVYIPRGKSKRLISKNLDIFLKTIRAKPMIISIEPYLKILNTFLPRTAKSSLHESISALILRRYADSKNAILVRPYTYTHWILGLFDDICLKTTDYLPFIKIFYSHLNYISFLFRLDRYVSKAEIDTRIRRILNEYKIPSIDILDRVLDHISNSPIGVDFDELSKKYKVSPDTVKKLLNLMRDNSFKKLTPTPLP